MKAYELITKLMLVPAGTEILVNMAATLNSPVEAANVDGEYFLITGGDAEVVDAEGEPIGYLSELARAEQPA